MLTLLPIWFSLLLCSFALGRVGLRLLQSPLRPDGGTHFFLSVWLGLFLWADLLLLCAALGPLRPWHGLAALLLSLILLWRDPQAKPRATLPWLLAGLLIGCGTLPMGLQLITTHDSVSYHYDIIAWLSQIGTVPGLGLIHSRFGFLSSWFTFPALLNVGPLEARTAGVAGSFLLMVAGLQLCWTLTQALRGCIRRSDLLAGCALVLALFFPAMLNLASTPSDDVPVAVLSVLCFWALLLTSPSSSPRWQLLPIVFAALALPVKLSSLPFLALCGLVGLFRSGGSWRFALSAGLISALLILPWVWNQVLLTGWPLYPLGFRLDLPWALSEATRTYEVEQVRHYAPWPLLKTEGLAGCLSGWLQRDGTQVLALGYLLLAAAGAAVVLSPKGKSIPRGPFLLGLGGSLFWLWTTAHPRFGWGSLALLPSGLLLLLRKKTKAPRKLPLHLPLLGGLAVLALLVLPNLLFQTRSERMVWQAIDEGRIPAPGSVWLHPPKVPAVQFPNEQGVATQVESDIVEADLLPMPERAMVYRLDLRRELQLRDPDRGLRGGFVPIADP